MWQVFLNEFHRAEFWARPFEFFAVWLVFFVFEATLDQNKKIKTVQ